MTTQNTIQTSAEYHSQQAAIRASRESDYYLAKVYFSYSNEWVDCVVKRFFSSFIVITEPSDTADWYVYQWSTQECTDHKLVTKRDAKNKQIKASEQDQVLWHNRYIKHIVDKAMEADW